MGGEKRTFLPYSRGLQPAKLRIGTLAIDVYNPATGLETERFSFYESLSQKEYDDLITQYTGEPQLDNACSLGFRVTDEWYSHIGIANLVHAHIQPKETLWAVLRGSDGRRFEIRKPRDFLMNVVLKQDGAREWIRDIFSIQAKGVLQKGKLAWKTPKIWLCTGIQLIKQGEVIWHRSQANSYGGGVNLDPGLIVGGVPTGQSVFKVQAGNSSTTHANNEYGHADERVWAAQWFQLDVDFRQRMSGDEDKPMVVNLKPVEDLEYGIRKFESGSSEPNSTAADAELIEVAEIVGLRAPQDAGLTDQDENSHTDDSSGVDSLTVFDERPFAKAMEGIDWEMYRKYDSYLKAYEETDLVDQGSV